MSVVNPVHHLQFVKRIADPIHGLIQLTEMEYNIVKHPIFQRLRNITQLGMAKYVYPGSTHNRFSHSLGVMHNVSKIFTSAYDNWLQNKEICGDIHADEIFSENMLQVTRIAALCHDIGHFPFSHNLEGAVRWLSDKQFIKESFLHEDLSAYLLKHYFNDLLDDLTEQVSALILGDYSVLGRTLFPSFVISSAIDADRMDYLIRDSVYCGVEQGRFDGERLLDSILPYATKIDGKEHTVMGFKLKGIEALEQLLLARHRMHQTVYFNTAVVGYEAALRRGYYRLITSKNQYFDLPDIYFEDPDKFIEFDEYSFWTTYSKGLKQEKSWLVDPLLNRASLSKQGPFYHTLSIGENLSDEARETYSLLREIKERLEIPAEDWEDKDHWMYTEHKQQKLIDPLPRKIMNTTDGFEDSTSLKNVILMINSRGELVDPTRVAYGHTFLPYITDRIYHRFIFFTAHENRSQLKKEVSPILTKFEDYQVRRIPFQ
ncbi:MAG: HD domain-containing protein [Candidatus Heimdallarchaeota archaeon]|nr:HD domain-containing protein [Candidatus Heimdallarchaeota archaeon]